MNAISEHIVNSADAVVVMPEFTLKGVAFQRKYYAPKGDYYYEYRREVYVNAEGEAFDMKIGYTPEGYYIGESRWAYRLVKRKGLTDLQPRREHAVCSLGFSEAEQKWYGWSHRAIYGFGVGAVCKEGHAGFVPSTPQALFDAITTPDAYGIAWQKPEHVRLVDDGDRHGVEIIHPMTTPTKVDADGLLSGWLPAAPEVQFIACGRGEWTARTLDEAKAMAEDFAEGVS
jgi:hypothetical protein